MLSKYGLSNILILLGIALLLIIISVIFFKGWLFYSFLIVATIIIFFTLWFFRNPNRVLPVEAKNDESLIISPSDGKIIIIEELFEKHYLKEKCKKISIFLSPLDVHVNWIPVNGYVEYFKYNPGDYLVAWHPKSSELNEQTHIGIKSKFGSLFFKQITGIMARRLVWDINQGDTVKAGQKFGMMKFGSRIDIFLPLDAELFIKLNDKVVGGETIIAKFKKD
ncbi:MAG TPA: phosphatidylserine decarboxylase family protein [Candidatus Kapabacteria bacterium]|nr:phosphatidylserine decarboxylase family protein [Candidatus Kapabacteria bacterium]